MLRLCCAYAAPALLASTAHLNQLYPTVNCTVFTPGFGVARPALEICSYRALAVNAPLPLLKKCRPNAAWVRKLVVEVRAGTSVLVNNTPPPISKYGTTRPAEVKFHFRFKGLSP